MATEANPAGLRRTAGVVVGDDVRKLFEYARKNKFAIPAINVSSSSTAVAALEAARDMKAPIILQVSSGGSEFFAGKGHKLLSKPHAMIEGAIAAAHFIRSIAPSYGIPVILHTDHCHLKELPWLDGLLEADEEYNATFHEQIKTAKPIREAILKKRQAALIADKETFETEKNDPKKEVDVEATEADFKLREKDLESRKMELQILEKEIQAHLTNAELKEPLFSSHMIDLSNQPKDFNIEQTKKRLEISKAVGTWLEMEIGITGGQEDGVNNENAENSKLYTNPEDIWEVYSNLLQISPDFSIAAAFGNVHGVYKVGAVKLRPWLLGKHQKYVKAKIQDPKAEVPGAEVPDQLDDTNTKESDTNEEPEEKNPVFFVFHGGSGSAKEEFLTGISHGVVKVNIDTDTQWAYCSGVRDYMVSNLERLELPVGTKKNPSGAPNKSLFDPRVWIRQGEISMKERVEQALKDFNAAGKWTVAKA